MSRPFALACVVLAGVTALSAVAPSGRTPALAAPLPASAEQRLDHNDFAQPPDAGQCRAGFGLTCYGPAQLRRAYGVETLAQRGIDGAGTTIAVITSYGSPTIEHDLRVFDRAWGLPDPPSITTITPAGSVPPFDPDDAQMKAWALETTLDVQYAHVMAPRASILVVATPVAETDEIQGFPEIVAAENYVIDHGLADVISQSLGAAEPTFPSVQRLRSLRGALVNAAQHGVTMLAGSGDAGVSGYESDQETLFPYPVQSWPGSDPLVTSVGGTRLDLDAGGRRLLPDRTWNDAYGAGGGGTSEVFARPAYQDRVQNVVGDQRGTPDISLSAAVDGGVVVYSSYDPDDTGWGIVGGTSEAAPLFAGVIALAVQMAGHRLGPVNPALYRLAGQPGSGIVDITAGDNSFDGVSGYPAGTGYDLASGLGTIDAARLVPALAAAVTR